MTSLTAAAMDQGVSGKRPFGEPATTMRRASTVRLPAARRGAAPWLSSVHPLVGCSAAAQNRKDAAHVGSSSNAGYRRGNMINVVPGPQRARHTSHTLRPGRALGVWFVMMAAETVHGVLRQILLAPLVGDLRARQIGVVVGSALIYAIVWWLGRSIGARTVRSQLAVGVVWVTLTLAFELSLGMLLGLSWQRMLADYDLGAGGLMPFGLLFLALSPALVARLSARRERAPDRAASH
jgi:hypothetical protein